MATYKNLQTFKNNQVELVLRIKETNKSKRFEVVAMGEDPLVMHTAEFTDSDINSASYRTAYKFVLIEFASCINRYIMRQIH